MDINHLITCLLQEKNVHMKSSILLLATIFYFSFAGNAQSTENTLVRVTPEEQQKYSIEYVMGPYLFIDNILYDAALMQGCRLGFKLNQRFNFSIEYVVGENDDQLDILGLVHNANAQLTYYFKPSSTPFKPYMFAGGGFFEFKEYSTDTYGISWNLGGGVNARFTNHLSGILEARYLNLAQLDLGGQHQMGVFWGARFSF